MLRPVTRVTCRAAPGSATGATQRLLTPIDRREPGQVLAVGADPDIDVIRIVEEDLARDQLGLLGMRLLRKPDERQCRTQDGGALQKMAAIDRRGGHANLRGGSDGCYRRENRYFAIWRNARQRSPPQHFVTDPSRTRSRPRGRFSPELCKFVAPLPTEGAGNAGCALHPRSRVPMRMRKRCARAYR